LENADAQISPEVESAMTSASGARTNAERLLTSAEGFVSVADAAVAGAGSHAFDGPRTAVLFFMFAQAAEIAVKAWLVMVGVPLRNLPNSHLYGHDLEKILTKAKARGFAPTVELSERQLSLLNQVYDAAKKLQYPVADGFVLPPCAATREMVDAFITSATIKVRGQVDRNRLGASIGFGAIYKL
jgi:HEPN domain-containing protein